MSSKQMSLNLNKAYAELIVAGKPAPSSAETRLVKMEKLPRPRKAVRTPMGVMVGETPVHDPNGLLDLETLDYDAQLGDLKIRTRSARVWIDRKKTATVQWWTEGGKWIIVGRYREVE